MIALRAPSHAPTGTPTLPHAEPRAAGASHALLHAHRVKTARTSPRARKHAQRHFRAVPCASALCWRPMAGPRRPHQPRASRTTRPRRTTTHADARRSAPLTAVSAHCTSACTFFRHHTAPERDATGKTLHREARAAARRARRPPSSRYVTRAGLLCSLHADCTAALLVLNIQPACPRCAPAATRLVCTARGARVARCAHAPPSVQSAVQSVCTQHRAHTASLPAHTAKYTAYSTMCTHTPNDAARTPQQ